MLTGRYNRGMVSPDPAIADARVRQLLSANQLQEAERLCREVLASHPSDPAALHHLGVIAIRCGQFQAGADLIRRAIAHRADIAEYYFNLSQALIQLRQPPDAIAALRRAVSLNPGFTSARMNLGALLCQENQLDEAETEIRAALAQRPMDPALHVNLGRVLRWQEKLDPAIACFGRAIELNPSFAGAYNALGSALREAGSIGQAVAAFRKAVELKPTFNEARHNLLYALHFDPDTSPQENFAEHLRWAARFAEPLRSTIQPHGNSPDPDRPLRIAYVSPDLIRHPIGYFMEPILEQHDRAQVQVFCYADVDKDDEVTARLREHTDIWRNTYGLNDEQLARQIASDGIDVLIDLVQHMRRSRLGVFAAKPAPVQITHLAYCATSGMSAMDWCITDPLMSPPGPSEQWFTEKLLRLADCYWCYRPSAGSPPVAPLPAGESGPITFGSLNTLAKTNARVIDLWAKVLKTVPSSRLMVHATNGDANLAARAMFTRAGIDPARLILAGRATRDQYLALYNQIDIGLDPFPYGGGTTSLDALWMGVPLITLLGQTPLSRTGLTLLSRVGLDDLVAENEQQYVDFAAGLANDRPRLSKIRATLRQRLSESVLMDAKRYTRNLESAYRHAWRTWCQARPL